MFKRLGVAVLTAVFLLAGSVLWPAGADDKAGDKIRVILIDGQNNHNWRATTPLMKKVLEDCGRFTVDISSNLKANDKPGDVPTVAFPPDLSKYDVLLSNYNGAPWPEEFKKALDGRLKDGKIALVIVHAANNSFKGNWPEYDRMIGMGWRDNKYGDRLIVDDAGKPVRVPKGEGPGAGHGPQHAFQVVIRDPDHPVTKGMPREWMHAQDELYQGMRGPIENVHLLATAYASKDKKGSGEHEPMIWTVTYGKGRVFHTPMGHDLTGMRCLGFVATLQRGTEWAATGKVTLPLPQNFPTADKTNSLPAK
jgi:type 1 glutamine amidotransferase